MKSLGGCYCVLVFFLLVGQTYAYGNGADKTNGFELKQAQTSEQSVVDTTQTTLPANTVPKKIQPTALSAAQVVTLFNTTASNEQLTHLASQLQLGTQAKGQFQQTRHLAVLKRPLKSAGQFMFSQDIGLLWQQQTPFKSTLLLKQNTLLQQDSFGNIQQTTANQTSSAMAEQLPQLMQGLLTGDVDALAKDFHLYMAPDIDQHNPYWQLGLVAKDPLIAKAIGAMVLEGQQQIHRLTMLSEKPTIAEKDQLSGDKTVIEFAHVSPTLSKMDLQQFDLKPTSSVTEGQ
ncbi:hypothetical protein A9267_15585 [Shewanella sp. UCD-FRSSP16_17]|uniref:outer membrane lipoprotein carrier protein LolA n=1 Tax=Shewanella sp. UCD-FRSSP16_17 TaxID=1853256 RepID=UPI0007EEC827|nr:outer membrane lipoprotein carrier protein LolA [Shewanella sp. UCD-FRSSP16_17]OBT05284.1 hypothetical protein A9267_15585 [Shewanella sp. UCD-FRSSP16_17]